MKKTTTLLAALIFSAGSGLVTAQDGPGDEHSKRGSQHADKDGDHQVTQEEFTQAHGQRSLHRFTRLDGNGDGFLTPDEFEAIANHPRAEKIRKRAKERGAHPPRFGDIDASGDQSVSLDEFTAGHADELAKRFEHMDKDGNGILSRDEIKPRGHRGPVHDPRDRREWRGRGEDAAERDDISREKADKRYRKLRERIGHDRKHVREDGHDGDRRDGRNRRENFRKRVEGAVERGDISREEADEKYRKLRKRIGQDRKHVREDAYDGDRQDRHGRWEGIRNRVEDAVERGDISREEADEKYRKLRKRIGQDRKDGCIYDRHSDNRDVRNRRKGRDDHHDEVGPSI